MKNILTIIITLAIPCLLIAQDNTFNGPGTDWDTPSNWSTGKVPPSDIVQKITIASNCEVSNADDYTFYEGSTFRIDAGMTFTNNGTGTWTMEGLMDNEGTYIGNLVIAGNIEPGDNASTWSCGDDLVYGGKTYATVQIGGQCWMAENLNVGTMITGSSNQTDNNIIEKYCYGNSSSDCDTYGGLYQWNEMMQYSTIESTQSVCPTGWHLPSDAEWMMLEETLGMCTGTGSGCSGATGWRGTNEGSKMAGNAALWTNGNLENDPEFGTSGLDVLPAGGRNTNGSFFSQGYFTYLWSSSENGSNAWFRYLVYSLTQVGRDGNSKALGFSVRCVRD